MHLVNDRIELAVVRIAADPERNRARLERRRPGRRPGLLRHRCRRIEVKRILDAHFAENNNAEVWKQCLSQIDLTTLNGDDTVKKVKGMAEAVNGFKAQFPGLPDVASICVYPAMVPTVKEYLKAPGVGITSVAGGFPASQTFIEVKVAEVALAVAAGATEIDIVLSQGKFLEGRYEECFEEIEEQKAAARDAHFKVILETGALKTADNIAKASVLAMAAGADFIKTLLWSRR